MEFSWVVANDTESVSTVVKSYVTTIFIHYYILLSKIKIRELQFVIYVIYYQKKKLTLVENNV